MAVSHRGAISFGMVHIPVGLYTATQDNDIHFNQLCLFSIKVFQNRLCVRNLDFLDSIMDEIEVFSRVLVFH